MARKKKTAAPEPELEIRADPELIEDPEVIADPEELEPVKPERSHTELMMLRGLGLLPPGEDFIPTSLFVSNNVLTSGMGGDLEADIDASGIASFNIPGKAFTNIEELFVDIVPVQEGSGDPSPVNVRPISGWSEAKVTRTGENLFDGTTFTQGAISSSTGEETTSTGRIRSGYIGVSAGNYTVMNRNGLQITVFCYDGSQQYIQAESLTSWSAGSSLDVTIVNAKYVRIAFRKPDNSRLVPSEFTSGVFGGSSTSYTISLGDTRYGAELDVTRGKLRVTHGNIASYAGETINEPWISSMDVYASGATPTTGAQVVYPLTTPIEVDLTPVQITALLGDNHIWADCGPVTKLEYSYDLLINQY